VANWLKPSATHGSIEEKLIQLNVVAKVVAAQAVTMAKASIPKSPGENSRRMPATWKRAWDGLSKRHRVWSLMRSQGLSMVFMGVDGFDQCLMVS
jgi:hypothetical protein